MTKKGKATDRQVGGSHYKMYEIQPYEFFLRNKITHEKAAIIRRILRFDHETGKGLEDLQKIKHEVDLIIQLHPMFNEKEELHEEAPCAAVSRRIDRGSAGGQAPL